MSVRLFVKRTTRAVKLVIGHESIPRPLRWLAALGLLPVPGPFDDAVLLFAALILAIFYRSAIREAWAQAKLDELASRS